MCAENIRSNEEAELLGCAPAPNSHNNEHYRSAWGGVLKKLKLSLIIRTLVILASLFRIMGVEMFVPLLQVTTSWASPVSRFYAQLMQQLVQLWTY